MAKSTPTPSSAVPAKKSLYLSHTRNDTFQTCTQLYAAKYLWRIPDPGNDGSSRGDVVHRVLECLANPRHRKTYEAAVQHQTCREVPALWRLIRWAARQNGVDDIDNLNLIDRFTMVALMNEFHGPKGTFESIAEMPFELDVNELDGRRFRLRGFIDRTFKVRDAKGLLLVQLDYKTSKQLPDDDKIAFNPQGIMYQLVARRLFPEFKRRRFRFAYLKFGESPWVDDEPMTEDQLTGYEWILTDLQQVLEAFTLDNAGDNLAAFAKDRSWLCGKPDRVKKDGKPYWVCPAHKPLDYWVIVDGQGVHVTSAFTREELEGKKVAAIEREKVRPPKTGRGSASEWRIEERHYGGCTAFWKDGKRRNWQ